MKTKFKTLTLLMMFMIFSSSASSLTNPIINNDKQVNANELVNKTERAVAFIVKSGQSTKDSNLKRSNKASAPFWSSVKKLNTAVEKLNNYMFLKDDKFHKALGEAVTAKEEVITTYELLDAQDAGVKDGLDKASKAIDLLYENYSKEGLRMKQGEALSSKEKEKLEAVKAQNKTLQGKLTELEAKVGNDKKMIKKLKKIREKSNQVTHCHNNSAGFFFAMSAMNMINGWMWGAHYWWGPYGGWYPGFYYGYIDIYVHAYDDYAYDWGYLDGAIDSYDYDLEVELDQMDIDTMDDYMNDIEYEAEPFNSQSDLNDYQDHSNDSFEAVDQMDYIQEQEMPSMQPQVEYEAMDNYPAMDNMNSMDSMDSYDGSMDMMDY